MKISELAAYRENIASMKLQQSLLAARKEMDPVIHAVSSRAPHLPQILDSLTHHRDRALGEMEAFDRDIDLVLDHVLEQIKSQEPTYLARSYQLYEDGMRGDSVEHVLNRRFSITSQNQAYIQSRVQAHSMWKYAGMIIRPGLEHWIDNMVACDPLYLVDTKQELFAPSREKFNPVYQNRLRYYAIKEKVGAPMMSALPDGQFGFVLAYNFFHYKPFEIMRGYLEEIYQKLRPGGVLGMTFNDCDRRGAVELAERMYTCYTPGRLVLSTCDTVGFQIEQNYALDAAVNWVELRRPGEMVGLRGGQTLAKIVAKSK